MPKNTPKTDQSNERLEQFEKELKELQVTFNEDENIFKILKNDGYEIRHSAFLAWLLDPNKPHGFKVKFLNKFFENFKNGLVKEGEEDTVIVRTEQEHIDILVTGKDFICVIENKYGSKVHGKQLENYIGTVEELRRKTYPNIPKENLYFVYLDLNDKCFNTKVRGKVHKNNHYELKEYKDVLKILKVLVKENEKEIKEPLKTYIEKYIEILEEKVQEEMGKNERINKLIDLYVRYDDVFEEIEKTCTERGILRKIILDCIEESSDFEYFLSDKEHVGFLPKELKEKFIGKEKKDCYFEFRFCKKGKTEVNTFTLKFVVGVHDDKYKSKKKLVLEKMRDIFNYPKKDRENFELSDIGVCLKDIEGKSHDEKKEYIKNKCNELKESGIYKTICEVLEKNY